MFNARGMDRTCSLKFQACLKVCIKYHSQILGKTGLLRIWIQNEGRCTGGFNAFQLARKHHPTRYDTSPWWCSTVSIPRSVWFSLIIPFLAGKFPPLRPYTNPANLIPWGCLHYIPHHIEVVGTEIIISTWFLNKVCSSDLSCSPWKMYKDASQELRLSNVVCCNQVLQDDHACHFIAAAFPVWFLRFIFKLVMQNSKSPLAVEVPEKLLRNSICDLSMS